MNKLEQAKLFLNFYFAPWGAAKGEVWETITNDKPFNDFEAQVELFHILEHRDYTEEQIKLMKIVVPD